MFKKIFTIFQNKKYKGQMVNWLLVNYSDKKSLHIGQTL